MTSVTPTELAQSPELAILRALELTLELATNALVAANPELESSDFVCEVPEPSVQACLADAINVHINGLHCAMHHYRLYVASADSRHRCLYSVTAAHSDF
jgi:hypothetical protein